MIIRNHVRLMLKKAQHLASLLLLLSASSALASGYYSKDALRSPILFSEHPLTTDNDEMAINGLIEQFNLLTKHLKDERCKNNQENSCRKKTNLQWIDRFLEGADQEKKIVSKELRQANWRSPIKSNWWIRDLEAQKKSIDDIRTKVKKEREALAIMPVELLDDMPPFSRLSQMQSYVDAKQNEFRLFMQKSKTQKQEEPIKETDIKAIASTKSELDLILEDHFYDKVYWGETYSKEKQLERLKFFLETSSIELNKIGCDSKNKNHTRDCKQFGKPIGTNPQTSPCLADHPVLSMLATQLRETAPLAEPTESLLLANLQQCTTQTKTAPLIQTITMSANPPVKPKAWCDQAIEQLRDTAQRAQLHLALAYRTQFPECKDQESLSWRQKIDQIIKKLNEKNISDPFIPTPLAMVDIERDFFLPPIQSCPFNESSKKLRLQIGKALIQLRELQEIELKGRQTTAYLQNPKRGLATSAGFDPKLFQSNQNQLEMEKRFSHSPRFQGEKTYACFAYGITSGMGEGRNGQRATELDANYLDQKIRSKIFQNRRGGIPITETLLNQVPKINVPSIEQPELSRAIRSMKSDFVGSGKYSLDDLRSLARGPGFVASINTDSRYEAGHQMSYSDHDVTTGHVLHVIDYSDEQIDLQTGKQEPMFRVRDSYSSQPMTYWINATDLALHLNGLIVIESTNQNN